MSVSEQEAVTIRTTWTAFVVQVGSNPPVTGTLNGDRWVLTWAGKYTDDRLTTAGHLKDITDLAAEVSMQLGLLEPRRREYEDARQTFSGWLKVRTGEDEG